MWVRAFQTIEASITLRTLGTNDIPFARTLALFIALCVTRVTSFRGALAGPKTTKEKYF